MEHTGSAAREALPLLASKAFQQRRRRDLAFPPGTFAEYEWDMLLVLCMKAASQPELRQIDLFNAAGVPHTTGLRMIERLEAAGIVVRRSGGSTLRKRLVALTADGFQRLARALPIPKPGRLERTAGGQGFTARTLDAIRPWSRSRLPECTIALWHGCTNLLAPLSGRAARVDWKSNAGRRKRARLYNSESP
jgi:DNA-binding MarR family transcriptional regulator